MRERMAYALLMHLFLVIAEGVTLFGIAAERGAALLTFYTDVAGVITFITSLIFCVAAGRVLLFGGRIPHTVRVLRYLSVTMLGVVVLVVFAVLAPLLGNAEPLLGGAMLYQHLICPALSMLSFFLLEGGAPLLRHHSLLALLPTVVYAAALYLLNALSAVSGPYPFFMIRDIPPVLAVAAALLILGAAILVGRLIRKLDARLTRR